MKKIGITLDFVIRDYLISLEQAYVKYHKTEPLRIESLKDLYKSFPLPMASSIEVDYDEDGFKLEEGLKRTIYNNDPTLYEDEELFKKFMTQDYAYEIFGGASETLKGAMHHVNLLNKELSELGHQMVLLVEDRIYGRPSTLYFLSKTSCMLNSILFVSSNSEELHHFNQIITADKEFAKGIDNIKIKSPYNDDFICAKEFNNIKELTVKDII